MLVGKSEDLSYVTLEPSDDFSAFKQKIENEIKAVDSSDGVLLLADLLGGSRTTRQPCASTAYTRNA